MSEERTLILKMLAEGKITVEEAEELLDALEAPSEKESAEKKTERTSFWNMGDFMGDFHDLCGKGSPFGKEGMFGEGGLFGECFGAKHRAGKTGWKGARCRGEHKEEERV